jgi:pimeloyl-ACP methyl ester carboxylesterase
MEAGRESRRTETIATRLGPLSVTCHGTAGPAVVLWHSMFLDGRSFDSILPVLTDGRSVFVIDGPGHGASPGPQTRYSLDDCADAAREVLDHLGLEKVDWVGNAWGGHVGVVLATRAPSRVRSLVAMSSPMQALRGLERLKLTALARVFAVVGWRPWLLEAVKDGLLLPETRARHPETEAYVAKAATTPGRERTLRAINSVMLGRRSLVDRLSSIEVPALFITSPRDPMWLPELARAHVRQLRRGRLEIMPETRHAPSLEDPAGLGALLSDWLPNGDGHALPRGVHPVRDAGHRPH